MNDLPLECDDFERKRLASAQSLNRTSPVDVATDSGLAPDRGFDSMSSQPASTIRLQEQGDETGIKRLHEAAFGPGRFARTAYRVREGCRLEPRLCLKAVSNGVLIGAIHFAPVTVGGEPGALLLGPLAIAPEYINQGWGLRLILESVRCAIALDYKLMVLVGDAPYYARAGFRKVPRGQIWLPGPADPDRILGLELAAGALSRYRGVIMGIPAADGM